MFKDITKTATAVATILFLSGSTYGQGAPLQITQTLDPPGTADLKSRSEVKKPLKSGSKKQQVVAPKAAPVDADLAARAAGVQIAPSGRSVKSASKHKGHGAKVTPRTKKVRGKTVSNNATPDTIEAVVPPASSLLTGDAAWAKLVGNSISGMYNGSFLVDAYLPDNTVKSKVNGEVQTGRWGIVDGKVCFQYPPETQATCYDVAVDGSEVTYTDSEGEASHFTLASGIPAGL